MITKTEITDAVSFLLQSAIDRDSSQGVFVYTKVLELVDATSDESSLRDVLGKLNRSLAGIEAHGDFTDKEFERVLFLRNGEN